MSTVDPQVMSEIQKMLGEAAHNYTAKREELDLSGGRLQEAEITLKRCLSEFYASLTGKEIIDS